MTSIEIREKLIDKTAAELVEELLEHREGGDPWFVIIRRKLQSYDSMKEALHIRDHWVEKRKP